MITLQKKFQHIIKLYDYLFQQLQLVSYQYHFTNQGEENKILDQHEPQKETRKNKNLP
ncbi:unnamed protein product [Paramecium sonneborni]|uniref:Uncharacterized protein n=1 Tax=Paramecium sonneborni TaxID=65129 RepID=A0A8S1KGG3_9CILI|nr:unnamed protein product [Paramecium sonneborni]